MSPLSRGIVVVVAYTTGMFVFSYLLVEIVELVGEYGSKSPVLFFGNAILLPALLGFLCQKILRATALRRMWPVVIGPYAYLCLRLLIDEVTLDWLGESWLELVAVAGFSALVALFGAWFAGRLSARDTADPAS